jgi:hypothetical protein
VLLFVQAVSPAGTPTPNQPRPPPPRQAGPSIRSHKFTASGPRAFTLAQGQQETAQDQSKLLSTTPAASQTSHRTFGCNSRRLNPQRPEHQAHHAPILWLQLPKAEPPKARTPGTARQLARFARSSQAHSPLTLGSFSGPLTSHQANQLRYARIKSRPAHGKPQRTVLCLFNLSPVDLPIIQPRENNSAPAKHLSFPAPG